MNCHEYLDQALRRTPRFGSPSSADSLSEHLLACSDCLSASPAISKFHTMQSLTAPSHFSQDILAKISGDYVPVEVLECEENELELSAFLDGELPSQREEQVILHLANCNDCTLVLSDLKGLSGVLGRSFQDTLPAPADFAAQVTMAAFDEPTGAQNKPLFVSPRASAPQSMSKGPQPLQINPGRRWSVWLSTAAAVLVTGLLSFQFMSPEPSGKDVGAMTKANVSHGPATEGMAAKAPVNAASSVAADKNDAWEGAAEPFLKSKRKKVGLVVLRKELEKKLTAAKVDPELEFALDTRQSLDSLVCFSALDMDQGRESVLRLVQPYQSVWKQDNDSESWDLELTKKQLVVLLVDLAQQPNMRLAYRQDGQNGAFAAERALSGGGIDAESKVKTKDKEYNPADDVARLQAEAKAEGTKRADRARKPEKKKAPAAKATPKPIVVVTPVKPEATGKLELGRAVQRVDHVVLESGWTLTGQILAENEKRIVMNSANRKIEIARTQIRTITRSLDRGLRDEAPGAREELCRVRLLLKRPGEKGALRKTKKKK
jgi:hypothetical protein